MGNTGVMRFGGCNLSGAVDHEGTMVRERQKADLNGSCRQRDEKLSVAKCLPKIVQGGSFP